MAKLLASHDPKEVIESGLSTGKRTQYAGPGTDTVMPQVCALECAADRPWKSEGPAKGIKAGIPPRPGLQWNAASHRWTKPSVGVSQVAQRAGVAFMPQAQTSHVYSPGSSFMYVRADANERTKFHALAHVLDQKYRISRYMDDDDELQVERDRLEQEIKARGESGVDATSAEEQLAEAFGRWMTDPEFEDTFPAMVEFMSHRVLGALDLKKEAVPPPVFPAQPMHAQRGEPAGHVLPVPEVRADTKQKREPIAAPVQQLKRIKLSLELLPL